MARQTKDQFINEMKKKPQTLGWDVILAFDRNKTNYLLMQDYISRFSAGSLFPPVNSSVVTTSGVVHALQGLQLDKPRLSFENAVITESRARCLMRTVGGRIVETSRPLGTSRDEVRRLGIADGLVGPILTMTIHLQNAPGSIGSAGKVELDLAGNGATGFELSGVDAQFEKGKLGDHLKETIAKWSDAQKKFQLSELRQNPGDALQPGKFHILTRPADGATLRSAEDFGDGEVLLLIGLDDRKGSLPITNTQIPYLLPEGYSSNLVISQALFLKRMIMGHLQDILTKYNVAFSESLVAGFSKLTATSGKVSMPSQERDLIGYPVFNHGSSVFLFADPCGPMSVQVKDDVVSLTWKGETPLIDAEAKYVFFNGGVTISTRKYSGQFKASWTMEQHFKASIGNDPSSHRKILLIDSCNEELENSYSITGGHGDKDQKENFEVGVSGYVHWCYLQLIFLRDKFSSVSQSVDAFRLNGLLFPNESAVVPSFVGLPGDLTILGDLAPDLTAYRLSEDEVVVVAQGTHNFTVVPANSKLTWSVAALAGEPDGEANIGKITANGQYTAPAAASFGFAFRRVIVTATDGTWTGKALVHLVAAPVSVFPLVNVVNLTSADDQGYLVWAASTNAAVLTGNITGNAGGTLTRTDDPDVQQAWRYKAPAVFPSDGTSKLEKVLRVDRVEVSQGGGQAVVCEMILTKTPKQEYFFKHEAVQDGVQFSFWLTNDDNQDVELSDEGVEWVLVCGHGVLDEHGKYTPSTTTVDHYVVVVAIDLEGGRTMMWNFKILPLPLVAAATIGESK